MCPKKPRIGAGADAWRAHEGGGGTHRAQSLRLRLRLARRGDGPVPTGAAGRFATIAAQSCSLTGDLAHSHRAPALGGALSAAALGRGHALGGAGLPPPPRCRRLDELT